MLAPITLSGVASGVSGGAYQLIYRQRNPGSFAFWNFRRQDGAVNNAGLVFIGVGAAVTTWTSAVVKQRNPDSEFRNELASGVQGSAWSTLGWLVSERFIR